MGKKFYITTPIYYVNASPHIGHSYTNIAADTLSRYYRQLLGKDNVRFLTGTDEHGQKIKKAADAKGVSPKEFTDTIVLQFKNLWQKLNISYDDFIRTTDKRHTDTVQAALSILYKKGLIYPSQYEGWYCTPCETFWTQTQLEEGQLCPDCKRPVEKISETNYFFKLGQYQDWLIEHINSHPDFIKPSSRQEEVLSFLRMNKLTDLCVSRPKERLSWGIPLPFSPEHVTYVWFDALINYISAVGSFDGDGKYSSEWWPADLHLIGKDILRQHAIYWPIMLRALDIEPPKGIFAHGWWMVGEDKMSKSRGNVIAPLDMVDKFGIDVYRYFLLRDVPFGLDGNFSEEAVIKRLNGDLANDLGNLVYRTLTMIEKYFDGKIPSGGVTAKDTQVEAIRRKIEALDDEVAGCISTGAERNFSLALEKIWELIGMANKYIEDTKPWNLSRENKIDELKGFIALLADVIRKVAHAVAPFIPQTSDSILAQMGHQQIKKGTPLFPRIDTSKQAT